MFIAYSRVQKGQIGNFGDELNQWLWPRIFNGFLQEDNLNFLGIGSILDNGFFKQMKVEGSNKIIFGSGMRAPQSISNLNVDSTWNVYFLRGPLSSLSLNNKFEYITDAAYALRQVDEFNNIINVKKKYEVSLIPYFYSETLFDWETICKSLGYHYISPRSEKGIEFTLNEIASSKMIITEAMHGAIVADLMRIPWHRFILTTHYYEGSLVSEFKWMDWLGSINLCDTETSIIPYYTETQLKESIKKMLNLIRHTKYRLPSDIKDNLLSKLSIIDHFYLSEEDVLRSIDMRIKSKIDQLKSNLI